MFGITENNVSDELKAMDATKLKHGIERKQEVGGFMFLLKGRFDLYREDTVSLFVTGGLGFSGIDGKMITRTIITDDDLKVIDDEANRKKMKDAITKLSKISEFDTKWGFGFEIGGGVAFEVTEGALIQVGARYVGMGNLELKPKTAAAADKDKNNNNTSASTHGNVTFGGFGAFIGLRFVV